MWAVLSYISTAKQEVVDLSKFLFMIDQAERKIENVSYVANILKYDGSKVGPSGHITKLTMRMFCRYLSVKTPDIPSDSDQQLVVRVKIVGNQDKRLANIVEKGVFDNQDEKKRICVWAALKSRAGYVVDCAVDILLWTMYYRCGLCTTTISSVAYVKFSSINSK